MKQPPEVLFVHGWATDSRVFAGVISAFDNASAVNLPSHGGRSTWDLPTIEPAVREVSAAIAQGKGASGAVGVGWSIGAFSLMAAALRAPDLFGALVLIAATPCFVKKDDFPYGQPRSLVERMRSDLLTDMPATLSRFYALNFTEEELKGKEAAEFTNLYKDMLTRGKGHVGCTHSSGTGGFDAEGLANALTALMDSDLSHEIDKISVPTLLIHGSEDAVHPLGGGKFIHERIGGSGMEVFEGAGHAPFITQPERFIALTKDFIEGL